VLWCYNTEPSVQESAQVITNELDSILPTHAHDLEKKLPGVGRYTAGAVASIAYNDQVSLVPSTIPLALQRQYPN